MPDFEREIDELCIMVADNPQKKARAEGFVDGKNYARWEVVCVTLTGYLALSAVLEYLGL